jgi:phage-related protein
MAATSFIWVPDYGSQQTSKPTVRSVRFGDGYEQRLSYGLATDLKVWNLSFTNITTSEKTQITGFLEARGGSQRFNWPTPDGVVSTFICQEWTSTIVVYDRWTVDATFREVVDL